MRTLFLLVLMLSCHYANAVRHYPSRGPFIHVVNDLTQSVPLVQHSPLRGGLTVSRELRPGQRVTFRWAFIDSRGMLMAGPWSTQVFAPWEADEWCWKLSQPQIVVGRCP